MNEAEKNKMKDRLEKLHPVDVRNEHMSMVVNLVKPPEDILKGLSEESFAEIYVRLLPIVNKDNKLDVAKKLFTTGKIIEEKPNNTEGKQCNFKSSFMELRKDRKKAALLHSALGMLGEALEIASNIFCHVYYLEELDEENLIEEGGDMTFYWRDFFESTLEHSREELMINNIIKLRARYPNGYSDENTFKRLDKQNGVTITETVEVEEDTP